MFAAPCAEAPLSVSCPCVMCEAYCLARVANINEPACRMLLSCWGPPGALAHTQVTRYVVQALSQAVQGCPRLCTQQHCCCRVLVPPPEWKQDVLQSL